MSKPKVYCTHDDYAFLNFYVKANDGDYFLFQQKYRSSLEDYYSKGVIIKDAINLSKAKFNEGLTKVMHKLPTYIKYIEKEYGIQILDRTKAVSIA